jgi:predicted esterase
MNSSVEIPIARFCCYAELVVASAILTQLGRYLDPEAVLLSPRRQVLENGMPPISPKTGQKTSLTKRIWFTEQMSWLIFLQQAAAHCWFDQQKLRAVGYSNGANIAVRLLLLRPETLCGAALPRPVVPPIPERLI